MKILPRYYILLTGYQTEEKKAENTNGKKVIAVGKHKRLISMISGLPEYSVRNKIIELRYEPNLCCRAGVYVTTVLVW